LPLPDSPLSMPSSTALFMRSARGYVTVGMAHRGYDLQLTRDDEKGWRATFYAKGDGALAHKRDGLSMGADTVARGPGWGARCT